MNLILEIFEEEEIDYWSLAIGYLLLEEGESGRNRRNVLRLSNNK